MLHPFRTGFLSLWNCNWKNIYMFFFFPQSNPVFPWPSFPGLIFSRDDVKWRVWRHLGRTLLACRKGRGLQTTCSLVLNKFAMWNSQRGFWKYIVGFGHSGLLVQVKIQPGRIDTNRGGGCCGCSSKSLVCCPGRGAGARRFALFSVLQIWKCSLFP